MDCELIHEFHFESAHFLPNVPLGHRCKNMHGHNYLVEVRLRGPIDPQTGFLIDFFEVQKVADPVIKEMDHCVLNDIKGLENPSAENIARFIFEKLKGPLPQLIQITVHETSFARCRYPAQIE